MAVPSVRLNTFIQKKQKLFVDPLSKLYIGAGCILGLNRLPIAVPDSRHISNILAFVYSLLFGASLVYAIHKYDKFESISAINNFAEFFFCVTFSFVTRRRTERYYKALNRFDVDVGCRLKVTSQSIKNLIFTLLLGVVFPIVCLLSDAFGGEQFDLCRIPLFLLYWLKLVELHYYGHLLSLLVLRLRLINYFVQSALSNGKFECPNVEELASFKSHHFKNTDMKNIMDLYYIVIKAYDFLSEAIKWQLLVIISTTFVSTLSFCYNFAACIIQKDKAMSEILINLVGTGAEIVPLFSPCIFCDQVHGEVKRMRELLASRLYENKLHKTGRSAARALLALTEARELSFSLLRMFQIDISLPFKFIGLLVTYLIILLQFDKVIHPSSFQNKTM